MVPGCVVALLAAAPAQAQDWAWGAPQRLSSQPGEVVRAVVDETGAATVAWNTQDGLYAASRPAGGEFGAAQRIGPRPPDFALVGNARGETLLAFPDSGGGASVMYRPPGGAFGPPAKLWGSAFDTALPPALAIADSGAATAAAPAELDGVVVAVRAPGAGFGPAQEVRDPWQKRPTGVGVGIDDAGNAVAAYTVRDCPDLPPEYRCGAPVRASIRAAGSGFGSPATIGEGSGNSDVPRVATAPGGRTIVAWSSCTSQRNCQLTTFVSEGRLPGGFGVPVALAGPADGGGAQPEVAILADGRGVAWGWRPTRYRLGYATQADGAWDGRFADGTLMQHDTFAIDREGDVAFMGAAAADGVCQNCGPVQVQRWRVGGELGPPVAISENGPPPAGFAVALGRDGLAVAAYAHHSSQVGTFARVYDVQRVQTPPDSSAPQVAVVAPPRPARNGLAVRLTCDERCSVAATGRLRASSLAVRLTSKRRTLAAEREGTIRLVVGTRSRRALARALARRGRRVLALRMAVIDDEGNRRVVRRSLVVRGRLSA